MLLSGWIKANKGMLARIGTKNGSGYVFAGVVDSFTLNRIERYKGVKMHARRVLEVFPSVYGGVNVLVDGSEYGTCEHDFMPPIPDDIPIEHYHELIGSLTKMAAEDYMNALLKFRFAVKPHEIVKAAADIRISAEFFTSPYFATLMPHVDGYDVLTLLERSVDWKGHEE